MKHTTAMSLLPVAATLLAAPCPALQAQESESFEFGALSILIDSGPSNMFELLDPYGWLGERLGFGVDTAERLSASSLAEMFEAALQARRDGEELRYLRGEEELLLEFSAAPARIAEAKRIYEFLERIVTDVRRFEVVCMPSDGPSGGGVIPTGDALKAIQAATNSGAEVRRWVLSMGPGSTGHLSDLEQISFVADYDVEIASSAWIHDPEVCEPQLGLSLAARSAAVSGGYNLRLLFERSEAIGGVIGSELTFGGLVGREGGPVEELLSRAVLENLEVATRGVAVDVFLGADQALDLRLDWDLAGTQVSERYIVRALEGTSGAVHRLALGGRELVLVETPGAVPGRFEFHVDGSPLDPSLHHPSPRWAGFTGEESGGLYEDLVGFAARQDVNTVGPWTWIVHETGGGPDEAAYERTLRALDARPAAPRTVRFQVGRGGQAFVSGSMPARVGAPAAAWVARGTLMIADNDVEVASSSSVIDTKVRPRLEGAFLTCELSERSAGLAGDVELEAAVRSGDRRRLVLESLGGSAIDLMPMQSLRDVRSVSGSDTELLVDLGQASGAGGLGGRLEVR